MVLGCVQKAIAFVMLCSLSEAAEESAVKWVVGAVDADCSTVCATIDSECVEGAWPNTAQEWDSVASSAEGLLCLASAPGGWIHNPSICTDDGPAPGVCFWQGGGSSTRCSGGMGQFPSTVARRICPCQEREEQEESASAFMSAFNVATITAATKVGQREPLKIPVEIRVQTHERRHLWQASARQSHVRSGHHRSEWSGPIWQRVLFGKLHR
ncbi:unnamed protein product [Cladocopium goreaui]|uniref:Uncharacterized protein n=1 Tax=Cladocopium goreaui TaxID=2562237 RepID=A0A9P1DBV2_9DINO|nr:unnamed protein product [Cladocopium goreaui]